MELAGQMYGRRCCCPRTYATPPAQFRRAISKLAAAPKLVSPKHVHVIRALRNSSSNTPQPRSGQVLLGKIGIWTVSVLTAGAFLPVLQLSGAGPGGGSGWPVLGGWDGSGGSNWVGFGLAKADEPEEDDDTSGSSDEEPTQTQAKKQKLTDSSDKTGSKSANSTDSGSKPRQRKGDKICTEVVFEGYPNLTEGFAYPTQEELLLSLNTQAGYIFEDRDLQEDKRNLAMDAARGGVAWNVSVRTEPIDDTTNNQRVVFTFEKPMEKNKVLTVGIQGASLMPVDIQEHILTRCQSMLDHNEPQNEVIAFMVENVRKWYDEKGIPFVVVDDVCIDESYNMAYLRVEEGGRIRNVDVRYYREATEGEVSYTEGEVLPREEILRRVRLKPGDIYNNDDAMRTLNDIYATGLLADVRVAPEGDVFDPNGIVFKVQAFEENPNYVEVEADWAFDLKPLPTVPKLSDLVPGGAVAISRGNLFGKGETIDFTISTDNLLMPQGGVGFEFEYHEPWYRDNAERFFSVFEQSKLSPVFTAGPDGGSSGNVIVDRFGAKLWTYHTIPPGTSRMSHGLLLQRVLTMDEMGYPMAQADRQQKASPRTTLTGTAMDIGLSYQGYVTLDDTSFVGGELLGDRLTMQVDQGLGLGGLYNRHSLSVSKFRPLDDSYLYDKPSKTLVLHARLGNTVGELPPYEYFTLGGPYSVRGYNVGELGACKRFLEAAAEIRLPLHRFGLPKGYATYAFTEYGTDLGSSRNTPENPTLFYRKPGKGLSWGMGVRFQGCRFEYARDVNQGKGAWFINWGERF